MCFFGDDHGQSHGNTCSSLHLFWVKSNKAKFKFDSDLVKDHSMQLRFTSDWSQQMWKKCALMIYKFIFIATHSAKFVIILSFKQGACLYLFK
jgi:hypothetical protein